MTLEIQKQLEGSSRNDNINTGVELNMVPGEIGANVGATWLELIYQRKDNSAFLHFPSREKLSQTDASQLIGIDDTTFTNITGPDLQSALASIDALLTTPDLSGIVLQNGTTPMLEDWTVNKAIQVKQEVIVNPYTGFQSTSQNNNILLNASGNTWLISNAGSETLTQGTFSPSTNWTPAGDASFVSNKCVFTYGTGVGSITQANVNLAQDVASKTFYRLRFTPTFISTKGTYSFNITIGAYATVISSLTWVEGQEVNFYFLANTETLEGSSVVLSVASGSPGNTFTIDDVSLEKLTGGSIQTSGSFFRPKFRGYKLNMNRRVSNYQCNLDDSFILVDASSLTITLPPLKETMEGQVITIKNGFGVINTTVDGFSTDKIENSNYALLSLSLNSDTYYASWQGASPLWLRTAMVRGDIDI